MQGLAPQLIALAAIGTAFIFALHYRREETLRMLGDELGDALYDEARAQVRRTLARSVAGVVAVLGLSMVGAQWFSAQVDEPGTTTTRANDIAGPAAAIGMPTYNAAVDSSLLYETFESYTDTTSLKAAGYALSKAGGTLLIDSVTPLFGAKSFEAAWDSATTCSDESLGIQKNLNSVGGGLSDTIYVIEMNVRFESGYSFQNTGCGANESKFIVNYRTGAPGYGSEGKMAFVATGGTTSCPSDQITTALTGPRWMAAFQLDTGYTSVCGGQGNPRYDQDQGAAQKPDSINDGAIHHMVVMTETESGHETGDGRFRVWVDSVLVIDYDGRAGGNLADSVYTISQTSRPWAAYILGFPDVFNSGAPKNQSVYFDNVRVWAERGN